MANFTNKVGTWTASSNEALVSAGASTIALTQIDNISTSTLTITVKLATSTQAGVYFGATTSASNYQAVLIDIPNNDIIVLTTSTGTQATSALDFTGTLKASTFYTLRVEVSGTACVVYLDGVKQTDASGLTFTDGVCGLYASYNTAAARFSNLQVAVDSYFFPDSVISTAIAVGDALIDRRTQASFTTQLASNELYDWFDQEKQYMPYVLDRSYNTLPTFYRLQGFGDTNNTLVLRHRPVYSTVKLEENVASDGSATNFVTRTEGRGGDYVVYKDTGHIVFVNNWPRNGHQNLRLTYSWGTSTTSEEIKELSTRYAVRQLLIGYGAGEDGLAKLKSENDAYIAFLETYIPEATLLAAVGRTVPRVT